MLDKILNIFTSKNLNFNGALDKYDNRNFDYEVLAGGDNTISLPTKFLLQDNHYTNQGSTGRYKFGCVAFSTTNAINEISDIKKDPKILFEEMVKDGLLDINIGAYVIDGPKTAQKLGWITGFTQTSTIYQMKRALYGRKIIVSGTNKANWSLIKQKPFLLLYLFSSYGHAFCIVGYDDNLNGGCFICENSYGIGLGDKGRFYLKYSDVDKVLFQTRLALFTDKTEQFNLLKQYIEEAKNIGYINYANKLVSERKSKNYKLMQEALRVTFGMKQNLISK